MQTSKGFSTRGGRAELLRSRQLIAVAACIIFIGTLTTYYYSVESGFNPFPQQSSLSGAKICRSDTLSCPGFSLSGAYLRVLNRTDIISQQVSFNISSTEASPIARIAVYVNNVSLGTVEGPFAPNSPKSVALAVPTTMEVVPGTAYSIVVEGVSAASSGAPSTDYWQSVSVVAVAG